MCSVQQLKIHICMKLLDEYFWYILVVFLTFENTQKGNSKYMSSSIGSLVVSAYEVTLFRYISMQRIDVGGTWMLGGLELKIHWKSVCTMTIENTYGNHWWVFNILYWSHRALKCTVLMCFALMKYCQGAFSPPQSLKSMLYARLICWKN